MNLRTLITNSRFKKLRIIKKRNQIIIDEKIDHISLNFNNTIKYIYLDYSEDESNKIIIKTADNIYNDEDSLDFINFKDRNTDKIYKLFLKEDDFDVYVIACEEIAATTNYIDRKLLNVNNSNEVCELFITDGNLAVQKIN